jgi:hypothetical protein
VQALQSFSNRLGWRLIDVRVALFLLALLAVAALALVQGEQLRRSGFVQDLRAFLFREDTHVKTSSPRHGGGGSNHGASSSSDGGSQDGGGGQSGNDSNPIHPIAKPRNAAEAVRQALTDLRDHPNPKGTATVTVTTNGNMASSKEAEQTTMGGIPTRAFKNALELSGTSQQR